MKDFETEWNEWISDGGNSPNPITDYCSERNARRRAYEMLSCSDRLYCDEWITSFVQKMGQRGITVDWDLAIAKFESVGWYLYLQGLEADIELDTIPNRLPFAVHALVRFSENLGSEEW